MHFAAAVVAFLVFVFFDVLPDDVLLCIDNNHRQLERVWHSFDFGMLPNEDSVFSHN